MTRLWRAFLKGWCAMATYDLLRQKFEQLDKKAQQIWHHNQILTEWLRIARAALESLGVGTPVPPVDVEVLKRYRGLLGTLPVESDESADSDKGPEGSIAMHGLQ